MMQYSIIQGVQGICPTGWHIPMDEEWKVLEGAVDSKYGIGNSEWNKDDDYRGFDVGLNLKSTSGWYNNGNGTDLFGFSGLPSGFRKKNEEGLFYLRIGENVFWCSSTQDTLYGNDYKYNAWDRSLSWNDQKIGHYRLAKEQGFSVRCIKDE